MGNGTPIEQLHAIGIPTGIGTDGAAVHNTLDVWESLRLLALTQKHQQNNAEAMPLLRHPPPGHPQRRRRRQPPDTLGALEPGHQADIALLDLSAPHNQPLHDPRAALVYSVRASDVHTVLVAGEVVVRNRQLTKLTSPKSYPKPTTSPTPS